MSGIEQRLGQECRRRLAVRSSDAGSIELALRMPEVCCCNLSQCRAAMLYQQRSCLRMSCCQSREGLRRVGYDTCSSMLKNSVDVSIAIRRATTHCHKDRPGNYAARVIFDAGHSGISRSWTRETAATSRI